MRFRNEMDERPQGIRRRLGIVITLAACLVITVATDLSGREHVITVPENASEVELGRARDLAREHRRREPLDTIVIELPSQMALREPLLLDSIDSGRPSAPLVFRGDRHTGSILTGAVAIPTTPLDHSTDPIATMFSAETWPKIWVASVESVLQQVSPAFDRTLYSQDSLGGALSIFHGRVRLEPARWPAVGYVQTAVTPAIGSFQTLKAIPNLPSLAAERDLWVAGYWGRNWWYESVQVRPMPDGTLQIPKLYSPFLEDARVYLFNAAVALTAPGSYFFSPTERAVYFIPGQTAGAVPVLQIPVARNIVRLRNASNIRFENVAFERSIDVAVVLDDTHHVTLTQCAVRQTGKHGIVVTGGHDNRIEHCVIDETGQSGAVLGGGDPETFTAGHNSLSQSRISRPGRRVPAYRPAAKLTGVGNIIDHNVFVDGPHSALLVEGTDHVISGNDIGGFVQDTSDAGAIYFGMSAAWRRTKVTSNFIHNIHDRVGEGPAIGVYLDDQSSGQSIIGNVFRDVDLPILVGGGRDNSITENFFFNSLAARAPIFIDDRGLAQQASLWQPGGRLRLELEQLLRRRDAYRGRHTALDWVLQDRPGAPVNNRVEHNIGSQSHITTYTNESIRLLGTDYCNVSVTIGRISFPDNFAIAELAPGGGPKLVRTPVEVQRAHDNIEGLLFLKDVAAK